MALKGDRHILQTDISLTSTDLITKGQVCVFKNSGSGIAVGDFAGTCGTIANPSGYVPAGLALADMVNIDQTRQHRNFMQMQQLVGENMPLLTKGWVVTDQIIAGLSVKIGDPAYVTGSGLLTNVSVGTVQTPKVGRFESLLDEDGFAKVSIQLP